MQGTAISRDLVRARTAVTAMKAINEYSSHPEIRRCLQIAPTLRELGLECPAAQTRGSFPASEQGEFPESEESRQDHASLPNLGSFLLLWIYKR